ncbi:hypothetical protein DNTS_020243 [Danionella cerebrum]|uniref:Fibroblast growth factor n=1 Tax=Danionella cerebrum TaxID=2873325 RepID=A0A553MKS3_9TELE|nr:hypothetical protein DNTS_020243 [Danionella translucida]
MLILLLVSVCGSSFVSVESFPLQEPGLHLDWGESVRLRHLYAARHGLHLQISPEGKITGSYMQSSESLMEIWPVEAGCIVIKGVASSRYLCMDSKGKLFGSSSYTKEDCTFLERIQPDGYNIYVSSKHGTLLTLSSTTTSKSNTNDDTSASQFLPMVSTFTEEYIKQLSGEHQSPFASEQNQQLEFQLDSMDPFEKISQIVIQSPSFNKR